MSNHYTSVSFPTDANNVPSQPLQSYDEKPLDVDEIAVLSTGDEHVYTMKSEARAAKMFLRHVELIVKNKGREDNGRRRDTFTARVKYRYVLCRCHKDVKKVQVYVPSKLNNITDESGRIGVLSDLEYNTNLSWVNLYTYDSTNGHSENEATDKISIVHEGNDVLYKYTTEKEKILHMYDSNETTYNTARELTLKLKFVLRDDLNSYVYLMSAIAV